MKDFEEFLEAPRAVQWAVWNLRAGVFFLLGSIVTMLVGLLVLA